MPARQLQSGRLPGTAWPRALARAYSLRHRRWIRTPPEYLARLLLQAEYPMLATSHNLLCFYLCAGYLCAFQKNAGVLIFVDL
jgi:hypothetical protein